MNHSVTTLGGPEAGHPLYSLSCETCPWVARAVPTADACESMRAMHVAAPTGVSVAYMVVDHSGVCELVAGRLGSRLLLDTGAAEHALTEARHKVHSDG